MDLEPERPITTGSAQESDETVEIELNAEEHLELSQAANAVPVTARTAEPTIGLPEFAHDSLLYRRTARVDLVCNVVFAAVVLSIAAAVGWHAASVRPRAPAIPPRAAVVAVPAPPAEAPRPLVHVRNPFDTTELFEFPAETTESQAREAMAELLLQRARDRVAQGVTLRHAAIRDQARGAVHEQPEVLVTKLNGSTN